jgi:hypothetical protein
MEGMVMARQRIFAVEMMALGVVLGMGVLSGYRRYVSFPHAHPLRCLNPEMRLGTIWQSPDLEVEFRLHNGGREPVTIDHFRPSCGGCTDVEPESLMLRVGETGSVTARFDLTQVPIPGDEPQEFTQAVTAVVQGEDGEEVTVPMVAKGTMRPAYKLGAYWLDMGAILAGETVTRGIEVEPLGPGPYDDLEVLSVPEGFTAAAEQAEGGRFQLALTSPPGLEKVLWQEKVVFRAIGGGEPFVAGVVGLQGRPLADVVAVPGQVCFDSVPPDQEWVADVRLLSRTGQTLESVSVKPPEGIEVEAADPEAHEYSVRFRAESTEAVKGVLEFAVRDATGEEHKVRVPITATVLGGEPAGGGCGTCGG